jgi:hypothetical protein
MEVEVITRKLTIFKMLKGEYQVNNLNSGNQQDRIGNKELTDLIVHSLNGAETVQPRVTSRWRSGDAEMEQPRMPYSVRFHYRNHPNMLRTWRG